MKAKTKPVALRPGKEIIDAHPVTDVKPALPSGWLP